MRLLQFLIFLSISIGLSRMYGFHDIFDVDATLLDPETINQLLKCFKPNNKCTPAQQGLINYVINEMKQDCQKCNEDEKKRYNNGIGLLKGRPRLLLTFLHVVQQYKPHLMHGNLPTKFNYQDNQNYITRLILDACHSCKVKEIITYKLAIMELLKHPDLLKRLLYGLSLYHADAKPT